jgi:Ca-activated chloride channel family protein
MKPNTIPILMAAIFFTLGGRAFASDHGTITGVVTDVTTGAPLSGATVVVKGPGISALTGADGRFTIANVPAGFHTVKASMAGYRTATLRLLRVSKNATATANFKLKAEKPRTRDLKLDALKCQYAPTSPACGMVSAECDRSSCYLPPDFNTEEYARIYENKFLEVIHDPLSTFSIDVDPASYANVRRFLSGGQMPPKDAVRIEELVNYFTYDYPQPENGDPFAINVEMAGCPWNQAHKLVRIGLKGREVPTDKLPPANLVFLIDVSGSMQSPDKLPLLKSAFKMLVNELRPQDRIAIVVYASSEGLALPSTPGKDKKTILAVLDQLEAGGCTAGAAGIQLAYRVAKENFVKGGNNRVILATDGDFNVGVSSTSELIRMIEEKREQGIFLSVLGFGSGNLKDSRMEQLADKGNGNYAYIDNISEARKVLVSQMGGTLFTIAKDVKIQVEFNPARVRAYKLVGYENRMLAKEDFNDDKKDAGELGSGHTVTALYEIVPAGSKEPINSVDPLKYQTIQANPKAGASRELMTVKLRYKQPDGKASKLIVREVPDGDYAFEKASDDFRFASAVAEFGLLLRDSEHKGKSSYAQVLEIARDSRGKDPEGYRGEFLRLVDAAKGLDVAKK